MANVITSISLDSTDKEWVDINYGNLSQFVRTKIKEDRENTEKDSMNLDMMNRRFLGQSLIYILEGAVLLVFSPFFYPAFMPVAIFLACSGITLFAYGLYGAKKYYKKTEIVENKAVA